MTTTIQIIQGSTTVDINNNSTTKAEESFMTSAESSGVDRVEETITVIVQGANAAAIMTTRSTIIAILENARLAQSVLEMDRVYVKFQPDGSSAAWRSEILDYRIANESGIYAGPWSSLATELIIIWIRRNYWEANSETQIPLTNPSSSNNTSGITLYNHWDSTSGHKNYVEIAAADVVGDLPAPCRIEITNTHSGSDYTISSLWIGHNYKDPTNFVPILEAESATLANVVSSSDDSNGANAAQTFTANATMNLLYWTLPTSLLNSTAGGQFKIFIKFAAAMSLSTLVLGKYSSTINYGAYPIWYSPVVQPVLLGNHTTRMWDMWTTRIPPWQNATSNADLILYLKGFATTGITVSFDFIYLLPVGEGSYLYMFASGYAIVQNERLVYDGMIPSVWSDDGSGTNRIQTYQSIGGIRLQPNKLQRLYFLYGTSLDGTARSSANQTISVKMYYRPRRLTL